MFSKVSLAAAALAMGASTLVPVSTAEAQRGYHRGDRYSQGYYRGRDDYRARQRCKDGGTGTIVGAIAGGLLGRTIDTRGDRTLGTVLGGVGGAVAGNAIEKSNNPRYCR